jgi:hypothetical protein
MRSIQDAPLFEVARLPANRVGTKKNPARNIERLPLDEGLETNTIELLLR